ncbi:MAG: hypothetical protein GXP45_01310 [bacterium]|nr:hypothetical protein [bacterium]
MMQKIIKENQEIVRLEMNNSDSKELVEHIMQQQYKEEMRAEFVAQGESISFYVNTIREEAKDRLLQDIDPEYISYYEKVNNYLHAKFPSELEGKFIVFLDMCEGPHVENTKHIDPKSFKLAKLAGAYRRGDENNVMMTRIYMYAFSDKAELRKYLDFLEEAKKRDHRVLGKKMKLYTIDQENVGSGLILWKPNGALILNQIKRRFEDEQIKAGYVPVITPHIGKKKLREISGHR